jgi:hypothetical protein
MPIRNLLLVISIVVGSSAVMAAEESCGMRAVNLLVGGKTQELAGLFANQSELVKPLQRMAEGLGRVTNLQEESKPLAVGHKRFSIRSKDLPTEYQYTGYWISARSEMLGAIQFHVEQLAQSPCKLLAINLDIAQ